MGGAGRMRLPDTSWSRIVTVAVVTSPSTASTGSSGPRTRENDSCHSRSSLDRISTLKKIWSTPSPRTEQRGQRSSLVTHLRQCRLALLRLYVEICPFLSEVSYQRSGCLSRWPHLKWEILFSWPNSTCGGGSVLQIYHATPYED